MGSAPGVEVAERFFSGTGMSYDRVVRLFTLGFDIWWKRKILAKIPTNPAMVADQACGTGIVTLEIARKFPDCRVIGVELRDEYLGIARQKAGLLKMKNLEFVLGRAEDVFLEEGSFDCITSSYLAKYAEIDPLILNIKRMLRKGGVLIAHDFTYPSNPVFAGIWEFYFKIMQKIGSSMYPEWTTVFHELPEFIRQTPWVGEMKRSLHRYGFHDVSLESLTFGTSAIITARK